MVDVRVEEAWAVCSAAAARPAGVFHGRLALPLRRRRALRARRGRNPTRPSRSAAGLQAGLGLGVWAVPASSGGMLDGCPRRGAAG